MGHGAMQAQCLGQLETGQQKILCVELPHSLLSFYTQSSEAVQVKPVSKAEASSTQFFAHKYCFDWFRNNLLCAFKAVDLNCALFTDYSGFLSELCQGKVIKKPKQRKGSIWISRTWVLHF